METIKCWGYDYFNGIGVDFSRIFTSLVRYVSIHNVESGLLLNGTAYYNDIYSYIANTFVMGIKLENGANENHIFLGSVHPEMGGFVRLSGQALRAEMHISNI